MTHEDAPSHQGRYKIYVVRLQSRAARHPAFVARNPGYQEGRPVVYVGSTGQGIETRFEQHLAGGMMSSSRVRRYARRLFPWAYEGLPTFDDVSEARRFEEAYANELRSRGWSVWQN